MRFWPKHPWQLGRIVALALTVALAPMSWSAPILAQTNAQSLARARELYRQGVQLEAANDWAGALSKFEAVAAIKMSPQVRFHIARCQHHLGKLLEALGGYRMAEHEAESDRKAAETVRESRLGISEIEQKIPKLLLIRGNGAETASVTLDGVELGESSIGKEVPVNPGGHTVEWKTPDGRSDKAVFSVSEGEKKSVEVALATASPVASPIASVGQSEPDAPKNVASQSKSPLPWVAIGVGGAGLVAAGTFYLMRNSAINDLDSSCSDHRCPTSMKDTGNKGKTYTTLGNVSLGVGLVGLGVGTVLLLVQGKAPTPSEKAETSPVSKAKMTVLVGGSSHSAEANLVGTF